MARKKIAPQLSLETEEGVLVAPFTEVSRDENGYITGLEYGYDITFPSGEEKRISLRPEAANGNGRGTLTILVNEDGEDFDSWEFEDPGVRDYDTVAEARGER